MKNSQNDFDEVDILAQAKQGDSEAFGRLYDYYAEKIFRFLYPQLPTRMDAEDLTSETFLKAWRSLSTYREKGFPFSAFLYRIARNLVVDYYRREKRSRSGFAKLKSKFSSDDRKVSDFYFLAEEHQHIFAALSKLKENYRTVIVLRFLNELSIKEISRVMNRSEGAVRVLQHRALNILKELVDSNGDE